MNRALIRTEIQIIPPNIPDLVGEGTGVSTGSVAGTGVGGTGTGLNTAEILIVCLS